MCARRVNYDRIAPDYDKRFADGRPRPSAEVLLSLARETGAQRILEVGCGTGRWLIDLKPATHALVGLDYSAGMLREAQKRDGTLPLVHGRADLLPFGHRSFDLVYCVNALHHFDCQPAFIHQVRRLLRPGGAMAIVGMDPRQHRAKWYVYDYFDGAYERDLDRFPSWERVLDWALEAGFTETRLGLVEWIRDDKVGRQVLDDPYLDKNAASQLALLTDQEYAAGLDRLYATLALAEKSGQPPLFPVEIRLQMFVACAN